MKGLNCKPHTETNRRAPSNLHPKPLNPAAWDLRLDEGPSTVRIVVWHVELSGSQIKSDKAQIISVDLSSSHSAYGTISTRWACQPCILMWLYTIYKISLSGRPYNDLTVV